MTGLNWKVTAHLASPLAGDPPYLDAILEFKMAQKQGKARLVGKEAPCPPVGEVHLPLLRGDFGGVNGIPRCSGPILPGCRVAHEHFAKRIGLENASMLSESARTIVSTTGGWTKAYRLPLSVRPVDRVVWFIGGSRRRSLSSLLKTVRSIGKKCSQGYGRVVKWDVDQVESDWSWFAPSPDGTVLMRVLPWHDSLPEGLCGFKRSFGGFAAPYWHPDRAMDIIVPV